MCYHKSPPLTCTLAQEVWMDKKANDYQDQHAEAQDGANDYENIVTRHQIEVDGIGVLRSSAYDGVSNVKQVRTSI